MAITKHVQHVKSNQTVTTTVDNVDVISPKLPSYNDLKDGEIAVNYHKDYETLSIRNDNNGIVTFPNSNAVATMIENAMSDKQDTLTFDSTPTANSDNPVTSQGIKTYVDNGDKVREITTYQTSTPVAVNDTHDQAISKLIKIIADNETTTAASLTNLNNNKVDTDDLADVAFSGDYEDLINTPTQAQADWEEDDTTSPSYILNKPETLGEYDSVKVDAAYLTENGASTFSTQNVRFCITEELTLADSTEYEVGEGSILHFYNDGNLVTSSSNPATLTFNNTQIEAPMKQIFDMNLLIGGLMRNTEVYPEWWGAKGDGTTDDAAAINAAIFNAGHMPVVLTAENYLVKSTVGAFETSSNPRIISVYNRETDGKTAGSDATALRWDDTAPEYNIGMMLIIKHNLIGDSTLNGTVLSIDVCNAYVRVYGAIVVKSASDSAIGVQLGLNGNSVDSTNYYGDIKINSITRDYNVMTPYNITTSAAHCSTYNLGLGTGIQLTGFASNVKVTEIFGFKYGVWLREKTQSCSLEFGAITAIYPLYIRSKANGGYITRNNIDIKFSQTDTGLGTWNGGNNLGTEWIVNVTNSALIYEDYSTSNRCEVALNNFHLGDDNKVPQLPQNYLFYYNRTSGTPNHTGNKYTFNISLSSNATLLYFHQGTGGSKSADDEFWFGVNICLSQIDVAGSVWNMRMHNVNIHPTANTTTRWGLITEPIRLDTVVYTQSSAPDSFNGTVIPILYPNSVFNNYITYADTAPTTLNNHQMVIVDNTSTNITTGGLVKYAVYAKQNGSVALVGYHINEEFEPQFNASVASGITSADVSNWNGKQDAPLMVEIEYVDDSWDSEVRTASYEVTTDISLEDLANYIKEGRNVIIRDVTEGTAYEDDNMDYTPPEYWNNVYVNYDSNVLANYSPGFGTYDDIQNLYFWYDDNEDKIICDYYIDYSIDYMIQESVASQIEHEKYLNVTNYSVNASTGVITGTKSLVNTTDYTEITKIILKTSLTDEVYYLTTYSRNAINGKTTLILESESGKTIKCEVNPVIIDNSQRVILTQTVKSYITGITLDSTAQTVSNGVVDLDLTNYGNNVWYDSTKKRIYLRHGNTNLDYIDATAFIKDGMVDAVTVGNGTGNNADVTCLIITFNTDAGKSNIELPISQIFDANNYYTSSQVDDLLPSAGTGLTEDASHAFNHTNSVTANTNNVFKTFTYDAQGHVTAGTDASEIDFTVLLSTTLSSSFLNRCATNYATGAQIADDGIDYDHTRSNVPYTTLPYRRVTPPPQNIQPKN